MDTTQDTVTTEQQDAAAFSTGFDETRGTAPVEPIEKTVESPKVEDAAASDLQKTEAQPKADAPELDPRVKAQFDAVNATLSKFEGLPDRFRNLEGAIGGLKQLTGDLKTALADAKTVTESKGGAAPTEAEIAYASTSPELWAQMKEDFPDWSRLMGGELADIRAQLQKVQAPVDLSAHNADIDKRIADAETRARIKARIDLAHEDWEETAKSDAFVAWRRTQPPEINALGASSNPKDAIRMFDLYAEHRKQAAAKGEQKQRLERAVAPSGVVHTPPGEDPDKAFADGFKEVRGS